MTTIFQNAFKEEDVQNFKKYMDLIDDNAVFTMKIIPMYGLLDTRNKMLALMKKCNDHVLEHIKTIKANEENQTKIDEARNKGLKGVKK